MLKVFSPFTTLNTSCCSFLICRVSAEKNQLISLSRFLYMILCFILNALEFSFSFFSVAILIVFCLGVGLFGFILFEIFCASCAWTFLSFFRFRKFSAMISSNTFLCLSLFSLWVLYNVSVHILDVVLEVH